MKSKRIISFLCVLGVIPLAAGCNQGGGSSATGSTSGHISTSGEISTSEEEGYPVPSKLTIHYHRDDGNYENYGTFYAWAGGRDGHQYDSSYVTKDDFGLVFTCDAKADWGVHNIFNFIVKQKSTWDGQSLDTEIPYDKYVPTLEPDGTYSLEVWSVAETSQFIGVYATKEQASGSRIATCEIGSDWKSIKATGSRQDPTTGKSIPSKFTQYKVYGFDKSYYQLSAENQEKYKSRYVVTSGAADSDTINITLPHDVQANIVYSVEGVFEDDPSKTKSKAASLEGLYDSDVFLNKYTATTDKVPEKLGVTYTPSYTEFRLWAPTCARVQLVHYFYGSPASSTFDPVRNAGLDANEVFDMEYTNYGVWYFKMEHGDPDPVSGIRPYDTHGMYYNYKIYNANGSSEIVDPYAVSTGVSGLRGLVVNFNADNVTPEHYNEVPAKWDGAEDGYNINSFQDLTIYETNIRDITKDESWNGPSDVIPGTYGALTTKGTHLKNNSSITTGFDSLIDLGVNSFQIMPMFDYSNNESMYDDEGNPIDTPFNWGYNPQNYNAPEGVFSSSPRDGLCKVKEVREMVTNFALVPTTTDLPFRRRIIMDVVYNHVSSVGSHSFTKLCPYYFFRTTINAKGEKTYSDGSGCGNECRTEAPMMRRFIVDSLCHWASDYKIKGFRFDLMGLYDVTTMQQVKQALYNIDPDIVVYGEPWRGSSSSLDANDAAVDNCDGKTPKNISDKLFDSSDDPTIGHGQVGAFNDGGRSSIKGGDGWGDYNKHPDAGWITDSSGSDDSWNNVKKMMYGQGSGSLCAANPNQVINYASCHDNYTLYDQMTWNMGDKGTWYDTGLIDEWKNHIGRYTNENDPSKAPDPAHVAQAVACVESLVMISNGVAFMNGGEEIMRSKVEYKEKPTYKDKDGDIYKYSALIYGKLISHNSYTSNDETNSYKWGNKQIYLDQFNQIARAIKIRAKLTHIPYPDNCDEGQGKSVNSWGGGTLRGINIGGTTGYNIYLAGRVDGNIISGGLNNVIYESYPGDSYTYSSGNVHMSHWFDIVVDKLS